LDRELKGAIVATPDVCGWGGTLFNRLPYIKVGVDKASKANNLGATFNSHQKEVFDIQFNLASELQRSINVHCVRAHGWLFEYLRFNLILPTSHPTEIGLRNTQDPISPKYFSIHSVAPLIYSRPS
jgi:hypothetical protein